MQRWPHELREKYPSPPGSVSDRPWWKRDSTPLGVNLVRVDGAKPPNHRTHYPLHRVQDTNLFGIGFIEEFDKANPIPFPGLRVGQIWAVYRDRDEEMPPDLQVFTLVGYTTWSGWNFGHGGGISEKQLLDWCQQGYLIYDPCPGFAPWAPVER